MNLKKIIEKVKIHMIENKSLDSIISEIIYCFYCEENNKELFKLIVKNIDNMKISETNLKYLLKYIMQSLANKNKKYIDYDIYLKIKQRFPNFEIPTSIIDIPNFIEKLKNKSSIKKRIDFLLEIININFLTNYEIFDIIFCDLFKLEQDDKNTILLHYKRIFKSIQRIYFHLLKNRQDFTIIQIDFLFFSYLRTYMYLRRDMLVKYLDVFIENIQHFLNKNKKEIVTLYLLSLIDICNEEKKTIQKNKIINFLVGYLLDNKKLFKNILRLLLNTSFSFKNMYLDSFNEIINKLKEEKSKLLYNEYIILLMMILSIELPELDKENVIRINEAFKNNDLSNIYYYFIKTTFPQHKTKFYKEDFILFYIGEKYNYYNLIFNAYNKYKESKNNTLLFSQFIIDNYEEIISLFQKR